MSKDKIAPIDMKSGNPFKLLTAFALPLLLGNILQQMYNIIGSIIVGQFIGYIALTSVGSSFIVINMLSSIFMGLGTGAMVMVSQYLGGGEADNLRLTIDTVYTALMVGVIPLSVVSIMMTNPILDLIMMPDDARDGAYIYLAILMGGLIGSLGYNLNAGILQGIGDSKTPQIFLAISCLLNIALTLLLVVVIKFGVAGVAISTIVSQFFSWTFGIFYINHKYPELAIHPFGMKFDKEIFWQIIRLGLPAGIQQGLFSFGVMVMTRLVNQYGSVYAAGYSIASKMESFVFLPLQSVSIALVSYTAQNMGAGKTSRVSEGLRAALALGVGISLFALILIPTGPTLLRLFSSNPDVISAGMAFLNRVMPTYWLLCIMFILNNMLRGAGESLVPMVSQVLSLWVARIPAAYLMISLFGRDNIYFSYAVGWMLGLMISVPCFLSGRWKNKTITGKGL